MPGYEYQDKPIGQIIPLDNLTQKKKHPLPDQHFTTSAIKHKKA